MNKSLLSYLAMLLAFSLYTSETHGGGQPTTGPSIDIKPRMEDNRYRGVTAAGIIDAPPIVLWDLLTDYESDVKYIPNISESRILEKDGRRVLVHKKVKYLLFKFNVDIEYREEFEDMRLSWSQVKGPFSVSKGTWTLEPCEGNRTMARYVVELDHPLLTRWLAERLLKKNLPEMYHIINERAKRLHRESGSAVLLRHR
jgi:ribosome-associated toxin RatA of RatAB toxin-antitoxin module